MQEFHRQRLDDRSSVVEPGDEWPEAPLSAVYHHGEHWWSWQGHGWVVAGAPPPPFPFVEEPLDRATYGPEGTVWIFTTADLLLGYAHLPTQPTLAALNAALKKLGHTLGSGPIQGWRTPTTQDQPRGVTMPMTWIRCAIDGRIGTDEQVVHVVNFRHSNIENAPIDSPALKTFAGIVRDRWAAYFAATMGNGQAVAIQFPDELRYTEVRASVLTQNAPGEKPVWPLPTAVAPFAPNVGGTSSGSPLPYEVACGVSFNTNFRGTSRFRGRLYLGPLTVSLMAGDGQFAAPQVEGLGASLGTEFLQAIETATDYEAHVISQKYNTSAKITGIRMGKTPDSQRRRRRSRPENFLQVWGNPVGAL